MVATLAPEMLAAVPTLLAAAETGSATQAARALGTTPATVLRRISALEESLGVPLFTRMPTGLHPTPELAQVLPWAERAAGAVLGMQREVAGLDVSPRGTVRVATPPVLFERLLLQGLSSLEASHPGLVLEVASGTALVDLGRREADLALRVIRPTEGDLVAKKLMDYELVVAIAPSLAAQYETLAEVPWLTWDRTMSHIPEARWLRSRRPNARIAMMAAELGSLLAAARAGVGAVVVSESLAASVGGLVRLPTRETIQTGSLWLVAHRALREVPRVDAVWSWIEGCVGALGQEPLPLARGHERFVEREA